MGNKALVRRYFDEVLSLGLLERIDHLFAPSSSAILLPAVRWA